MPKKPSKQAPEDDKNSVMDVSKPGKSTPSANSRPIIVSRKPIVEDPMVRASTSPEMVPGPPVVSGKETRFKNLKRFKSTGISISPDGELKNEDNPKEENTNSDSEPSKTDTKPTLEKPEVKSSTPTLAAVKEIIEPNAKDEPEEEPEVAEKEAPKIMSKTKVIQPDTPDTKEESKDIEKKDDDSEDKSDKDEEKDEKADDSDKDDTKEEEFKSTVQPTDGLVDELAKQAVNKKNKEKEEKNEEAKKQQLTKLVNEKKYFLPIGQVTRRKQDRNLVVIFLLIIILAVVGANFALDAGLFQAPAPIKPLTNLIAD